MRRSLRVLCFGSVALCLAGTAAAAADRLTLKPAKPGPIRATPMQPFTLELVAERGETATQMSAVAFTLGLPDGVLLVGEELLVESLLGLGNSRDGLNLVFECTSKSPLPVLRFRLVATKPLDGAVITLRPERKTNFLGLVSCREQDFTKFECKPDSVHVHAR